MDSKRKKLARKIKALKITCYTTRIAGYSVFAIMLIAGSAKLAITGEQFVFNYVWLCFALIGGGLLVLSCYLNPEYRPKLSDKEIRVFNKSGEYNNSEAESRTDTRKNTKEPTIKSSITEKP